MIKLPHHTPEFPRASGHEARANAWAGQWRHLPRNLRTLVSSAGRLRKLQGR